MEDFYSCPGEPEGEYRLYLPGFENLIVFEMEAAPALEGKQEHSEKAVSESSFCLGRAEKRNIRNGRRRQG